MSKFYTSKAVALGWLWLLLNTIYTFTVRGQDIVIVEDKIVSEQIGDCLLKRIQTTHDGVRGRKVFDVEVPSDGKYYLGSIISVPINNNKPKLLNLLLDGKQIEGADLSVSKVGFQNVSLHNQTDSLPTSLFLSKGVHQLSFELEGLILPIIDGIRLARNVAESILVDINKTLISKLKENSLPKDYLQKKKANGGRQAPNPQGNYYHDINLSLTYTYSSLFFFTAGTTVTFETRNSNTDPMMYLFQRSVPNPISHSWSNDDAIGLESGLTITIPTDGTYELMVRSLNSSAPGVSDIYQNGSLYASQVPVSGTVFYYSSKNTTVATFTTQTTQVPYITSDTKLYMGSFSSVFPIKNFNDDYYQNGGGDHNWGQDSRINTNFGGTAMYAIVSAYSTSSAGAYDFYGNCEFSDVTGSVFPNLKSDDAIQTAPFSGVYNCGSWAGGITSFWWFPDGWSDWSDPNGNWLQTFDNFYGNNPARYAGAFTYTRSGADTYNAMLALWYHSSKGYTHVSVRKPGNDNPHGYAWESKPGALMRTMHPRDALVNHGSSGYGSISNYYRHTGTTARMAASDRPISLDESLRLGLSTLDAAAFDEKDEQVIIKLRNKLASTDIDQFAKYFDNWQRTWNQPELLSASNPRAYTTSKEYEMLLSFCQKTGVALLPLFIERFKDHSLPVSTLIEDVLLPDNRALLKVVKEENAQKRYDDKNAYIVRSSAVNCVKFLRKLLIRQNIDEITISQNYPNTFNTLTTFRFFLPKGGKVSIEVYSAQNGQSVTRIADDLPFTSGWQTFDWSLKNTAIQPGTYFYRVVVDGKPVDTKRLIIR